VTYTERPKPRRRQVPVKRPVEVAFITATNVAFLACLPVVAPAYALLLIVRDMLAGRGQFFKTSAWSAMWSDL
jgi:hypothetical protein